MKVSKYNKFFDSDDGTKLAYNSLFSSMATLTKTKYQEILIQDSGKVEEVVIVRPALVPSVPINIPSKIMIIVTGIFMGLVIGMVFTFVAETLDTSIGTIEDVENSLNFKQEVF